MFVYISISRKPGSKTANASNEYRTGTPGSDRASSSWSALARREGIYRQILAQHPNHPEALYLLGVLAGQAGNPDAAIDLISRSVQLKSDSPEAYANLGSAPWQRGAIR